MRSWLSWPVILAAAVLAGCFSEHTAPSTGGEGVSVGNIFFRSNRNGTVNPAVDTVGVGASMTWTWVNTGPTAHSIESEAAPSFTSSTVLAGNGTTYSFTFTAPGSYRYDCAVHGAAMSGTIVVR